MWQTIAKSGADILVVGIENFNEDIRYAIGKKFSNDSITFHIEQAKLNGVMLEFLLIVGYVNETQQHIDNAKIWLDRHVQYKDIIMIQWGGTLGIFPNTYLAKNKDKLGVIMIGDTPNLWINPVIGSTPAQRAKWAHELNEHSTQLGYKVHDHLDNHFILEQLINTNV
jgi:radical SAM superfamily enzyme YgiQ (UPF0313 family)